MTRVMLFSNGPVSNHPPGLLATFIVVLATISDIDDVSLSTHGMLISIL